MTKEEVAKVEEGLRKVSIAMGSARFSAENLIQVFGTVPHAYFLREEIPSIENEIDKRPYFRKFEKRMGR